MVSNKKNQIINVVAKKTSDLIAKYIQCTNAWAENWGPYASPSQAIPPADSLSELFIHVPEFISTFKSTHVQYCCTAFQGETPFAFE